MRNLEGRLGCIVLMYEKIHVFSPFFTGQEEYDSLRRLSYPNTDVVLMCFSLDNPESLENIQNIWMPEVQHVLPTGTVVSPLFDFLGK